MVSAKNLDNMTAWSEVEKPNLPLEPLPVCEPYGWFASHLHPGLSLTPATKCHQWLFRTRSATAEMSKCPHCLGYQDHATATAFPATVQSTAWNTTMFDVTDFGLFPVGCFTARTVVIDCLFHELKWEAVTSAFSIVTRRTGTIGTSAIQRGVVESHLRPGSAVPGTSAQCLEFPKSNTVNLREKLQRVSHACQTQYVSALIPIYHCLSLYLSSYQSIYLPILASILFFPDSAQILYISFFSNQSSLIYMFNPSFLVSYCLFSVFLFFSPLLFSSLLFSSLPLNYLPLIFLLFP